MISCHGALLSLASPMPPEAAWLGTMCTSTSGISIGTAQGQAEIVISDTGEGIRAETYGTKDTLVGYVTLSPGNYSALLEGNPVQADRAMSADLAFSSTRPVGWSCRSRSPAEVPRKVLSIWCSANPYSFRSTASMRKRVGLSKNAQRRRRGASGRARRRLHLVQFPLRFPFASRERATAAARHKANTRETGQPASIRSSSL